MFKKPEEVALFEAPVTQSSAGAFIEANTIELSVEEVKERHIIPVYNRDNEPLISHVDFIETVQDVVHKIFVQESILKPNVRMSHPIKGRIPEAKNKPASQLMEWEQTIYYERMMFVIEIPTIMEDVNGNMLSLMVGGVKPYNLDNLNTKRTQAEQHFKLFIGFKNRVCCNLCVSSDGFVEDLGLKNIHQLRNAVDHLISSYNHIKHLRDMRQLGENYLTETQFAQVVGRSRMYKYLPEVAKRDIPPMLLGDQQLGCVVRDYYKDQHFKHEDDGTLSLWKMYNLLTGANKSSYIDNFMDRTVNANQFVDLIQSDLRGIKKCWYLG